MIRYHHVAIGGTFASAFLTGLMGLCGEYGLAAYCALLCPLCIGLGRYLCDDE